MTRKNYSRNFTSIEGLADYSLSWDQKTGEKKKKTEDSNSNYGETAQRRTNVQSKIDEKKKRTCYEKRSVKNERQRKQTNKQGNPHEKKKNTMPQRNGAVLLWLM